MTRLKAGEILLCMVLGVLLFVIGIGIYDTFIGFPEELDQSSTSPKYNVGEQVHVETSMVFTIEKASYDSESGWRYEIFPYTEDRMWSGEFLEGAAEWRIIRKYDENVIMGHLGRRRKPEQETQ